MRAAGRRREAVAITVVRRAVRERRAADMAGCGFWEHGVEYNQEPGVGKTNCRCSSALGAVPLRTGVRGAWVREREGEGRRAAFVGDVLCGAEWVGGARDFPREIGSFGPRDA